MERLPSEAVWLKPGQVAQRAGVAVSTLHYYEQLGLIRSRRTAGDRREYRRDTLRLIGFIRASQTLGVPLASIKEALDDLPHDQPPSKRDWARLARRWRHDLDDRIERLIALRDNASQLHRLRLPFADLMPLHQPSRRTRQRGARRPAPPPATRQTIRGNCARSPAAARSSQRSHAGTTSRRLSASGEQKQKWTDLTGQQWVVFLAANFCRTSVGESRRTPASDLRSYDAHRTGEVISMAQTSERQYGVDNRLTHSALRWDDCR